jgi:hypothetical protein
LSASSYTCTKFCMNIMTFQSTPASITSISYNLQQHGGHTNF